MNRQADGSYPPIPEDDLNLAWDRRNGAGDSAADPAIEALIARVHNLDDSPEPSSAFLSDLRRTLLVADVPTPIMPRPNERHAGLGIVAAPPFNGTKIRPLTMRLLVATIAATLLIAALSGGGHWLAGSGPVVSVASAEASPATAVNSTTPSAAVPPLPTRSAESRGSVASVVVGSGSRGGDRLPVLTATPRTSAAIGEDARPGSRDAVTHRILARIINDVRDSAAWAGRA